MLLARHRAHAETFRDIVAAMPLESGARILDVACGDGAWSRWLAERAGPSGSVLGLDSSADYLALATALDQRAPEGRDDGEVVYGQGDAHHLTFEDGTFDVVSCCHAFYEIDEPRVALSEMVRVLRPGGHLCLVTSDVFHHALLPWPSRLQVVVQEAQHRTLAKAGDRRPFLSRHMADVLADLGLKNITRRAFTTIRQGPLSEDERRYFFEWLRGIERCASDELTRQQREALRLSIAHDMRQTDEPSFAVTYTDMLTYATR